MFNADAVFEGGGVKGIAFIGAVCRMEDAGYRWNRLAGTSAGSIIASLLAVGYSGRELKKLLHSLDFNDFKEISKINNTNKNNILTNIKIPFIWDMFSFIINKGYYNGNSIETWLDSAFKAKGKSTFKDVSINGESKLKIIASDVTKNEMLILPDDLVKYNINPMDFPIAKAVRMSISIPFFFTPYALKSKNSFSYIVDGGIISNFPIWIFDVNHTPRFPTIGFKLLEPRIARESSVKKDILSYSLDVINTTINTHEERFIKNKDKIRTVFIPTLGVSSTDFQISSSKKNLLYNSGYESASDFIKIWDFNNYVKCYRNS
ncbi:MAG: patatin-like phospholipase family protein [Clostridiaceae bacterium]